MLKQTQPDLVARSILFAAEAHDGQFRKGNGMPYITHPIAVASAVANYTEDSRVVAAAVLHDVVEDTHVTSEQIARLFGDRVAEIVAMVTAISKKSDGNRAVRKAKDEEHYALGDEDGHLLKMCDIFHNLSDLDSLDDEEWKQKYLKEKMSLVKRLDKAPEDLISVVMNIIVEGMLKPQVEKILEDREIIVDKVILHHLEQIGITPEQAVEQEMVVRIDHGDFKETVLVHDEEILVFTGMNFIEQQGDLANISFPFDCIYEEFNV